MSTIVNYADNRYICNFLYLFIYTSAGTPREDISYLIRTLNIRDDGADSAAMSYITLGCAAAFEARRRRRFSGVTRVTLCPAASKPAAATQDAGGAISATGVADDPEQAHERPRDGTS